VAGKSLFIPKSETRAKIIKVSSDYEKPLISQTVELWGYEPCETVLHGKRWVCCTIVSPDFWREKTGMSLWNLLARFQQPTQKEKQRGICDKAPLGKPKPKD
jgi:hypothetical protein